MLNQLVMVGRITKDIEVNESEDGKKYTTMILAIPRTLKMNKVNMILIFFQ